MQTLYFYRSLESQKEALAVLDLMNCEVTNYHTKQGSKYFPSSQEHLETTISKDNAVLLTTYKNANFDTAEPTSINIDELAKKITSRQQAFQVFDALKKHGCELYQAKPAPNNPDPAHTPIQPTLKQFVTYVTSKKARKRKLKLKL